jgi:hypothetical protein
MYAQIIGVMAAIRPSGLLMVVELEFAQIQSHSNRGGVVTFGRFGLPSQLFCMGAFMF